MDTAELRELRKKQLKEIREYISFMSEFSKKEENTIRAIEQRFSTIYQHKQIVTKIIQNAKALQKRFLIKKKDEMKQQAIYLKDFIHENFGSIIEQEKQLAEQDKKLLQEENSYMIETQRVFAIDYSQFRGRISQKILGKTQAGAQLKKEFEKIKNIVKSQDRTKKINNSIIESIGRSKIYIVEIKEMVMSELELMDSFIFEEKFIASEKVAGKRQANKEALNNSIKKLLKLNNELTRLLRKEKNDVINKIQAALKDKRSMEEAAKNLVITKKEITQEMIKKDMRKLTSSPKEVQEYATTLLAFQESLQQTNRMQIVRYLQKLIQHTTYLIKEEAETVDSFSKLKNKKGFERDMLQQIQITNRKKAKFSLAMIDIDHFKGFNDTYGHDTGDQVLLFLADIMQQTVRAGMDEPYRWGGEEFTMIYSETDKEGAKKAANRLREKLKAESKKLMLEKNGVSTIKESEQRKEITISIGVSTYPDDGITIEELSKKADQALYYSKKTGRDKVTAAGEHEILEKEEKTVSA